MTTNLHVSADAMELMKQASMTAAVYMSEAFKWLEYRGLAPTEHPHLVAAFVNACCQDYNGACILGAGQHIAEGLSAVAHELDQIEDGIREINT